MPIIIRILISWLVGQIVLVFVVVFLKTEGEWVSKQVMCSVY